MIQKISQALGLIPEHLYAKALFNRLAADAAFARYSNAIRTPFRDANGSIVMKDAFGAGLAGYSVPLPDELKAKGGTIYPNGMQLITQPLWYEAASGTTNSAVINYFNTATSGSSGNMELAG